MKNFPKPGSKVIVKTIENVFLNSHTKTSEDVENFKQSLLEDIVVVNQSGTSEDVLVCYKETKNLGRVYFTTKLGDVESAYPLGKIYISLAISGKEETARADAEEAYNFLTKKGYEAINPFFVSHLDAERHSKIGHTGKELHKRYIAKDLDAMLDVDCNKICLLPNSELSVGVQIEIFTALKYGYEILSYPTLESINFDVV